MPRMDIIAAWRDGYEHGVKDTVAKCTCGATDPPRDRYDRVNQNVITIDQARARHALKNRSVKGAGPR